MNDVALPGQSPDLLDFDEDFIKIDAAICEYDSVGYAPQRKGEGAFQWVSVETGCLALLKKAKDVRVAIWHLRACIARRGLSGLADGTRLLADLMSAPVEELHPRALPDESPGETLLIHLGWLAGSQFLHQLGSSRFEDRDATLNDLIGGRAASIVEDPDYRIRANTLVHDIQDSLSRIRESIAAVEQELNVARALELLSVASSRLVQAHSEADEVNKTNAAGTESVDSTPGGAPAPDTRQPSAGPGGALRSRQEVGAALERIVEYFRLHEPSHPAPIFLSRIQRMLGAGFEEVMAELYPEAASLVAQLNRPQSSIK
ncbi:MULTISPECIES: type VI secretion system protein TssA [Burkholderia]|uniref:type VI secretion system protein TssA n=1 Tax=Burkholderia TaxID=32008 RepID=UPI000752E44C|nr:MULTISPECIES: type VI secretion system ImpA family N-terminal domain-containing protein [Burkholderia]AOJ72066.1 ImpA [Burkholderia savannae]KVG50110.1 ImpA [Burkholderia sp. MSMB0265]KVG80844.1 ImpA [Burkholderia sp. MSMB2040]KVG96788.1 ImpA [Burkholderia sp. MSMB2042]KVG98888.1 ImpA [Burkholderia sp. MSMB2041]